MTTNFSQEEHSQHPPTNRAEIFQRTRNGKTRHKYLDTDMSILLFVLTAMSGFCGAALFPLIEELNSGSEVHLMGLGVEQVGILGHGCGEGVVCRFQLLRFILFR